MEPRVWKEQVTLMDTKRLELRCADTPLIAFTFAQDELGEPGVRIEDVNDSALHLMPWGLSLSDASLWSWLSRRAIPQNRRYAEELCRAMGFSVSDVEAIYRVGLGLSLNDPYWTPSAEEAPPFSDVNLYENGFSAVLAAVAYTGVSSAGQSSPHGLSPELMTDGSLRKAWRAIGDKRVLYKGSTPGWVPGEAMSEALVSAVTRAAGVNAVGYGLDVWEGEACSTCECFCTTEVSYVPFAVATGATSLASALWWSMRLDPEGIEPLCDMLVLDALVANTDRHFTNFGILRDMVTGAPIGFAPVFDNGRGLFPRLPDDMLGEAHVEASLTRPAFGAMSFEGLAQRVMGERQARLLEKVVDADLDAVLADADLGDLEGAARKRMGLAQDFLRRRASELLALGTTDHEELCAAVERTVGERLEHDADAAFRPLGRPTSLVVPPLGRPLDNGPLLSQETRFAQRQNHQRDAQELSRG